MSKGTRSTECSRHSAHADHLTASDYLKKQRKVNVGIGKGIVGVQKLFGDIYSVPHEQLEGVFDHLFEDGEKITLGNTSIEVMHLPGHTPDHIG